MEVVAEKYREKKNWRNTPKSRLERIVVASQFLHHSQIAHYISCISRECAKHLLSVCNGRFSDWFSFSGVAVAARVCVAIFWPILSLSRSRLICFRWAPPYFVWSKSVYQQTSGKRECKSYRTDRQHFRCVCVGVRVCVCARACTHISLKSAIYYCWCYFFLLRLTFFSLRALQSPEW